MDTGKELFGFVAEIEKGHGVFEAFLIGGIEKTAEHGMELFDGRGSVFQVLGGFIENSGKLGHREDAFVHAGTIAWNAQWSFRSRRKRASTITTIRMKAMT